MVFAMIKILMCLKDRYPITRPDVKVLLAQGGGGRGFCFDFLCRAEDGVFSRRIEGIFKSRVIVFPGYFGRGVINYILDLWRYFEFVFRIVFAPYKVIMVRDEYFSAFLGCLFASLMRKPFVYWMSFPMYVQYEEAAQNAKGVKKYLLSIKARLTEKSVFGYVLKKANHVFCQSDAMKAVLIEKGVDEKKITPVPMGVDFSVVEKVVAEVRPILQPQGVLHLCCLTIHSRVRELDVLLEAAACLMRNRVLFKLWMVGGEDVPGEIQRLKEITNKFGLSDVVEFTGQIPQIEAFRLVRGCDIGISVIPRGPLFDVSSPTKILEYIALEVPVVVNDIPDQEFIVNGSGFGRVVKFDADSIAKGIVSFLDNVDDLSNFACDASLYVKSIRDYSVLTELVFSKINLVLER